VLKNYLHGKTSYIEILFILKNLPTLTKLLGFKNWLYGKTTYIGKSLQTSKKRKSQKNGIGIFHIYVQYLYTNDDYRKVAQKL
jgi:hypothetical protein